MKESIEIPEFLLTLMNRSRERPAWVKPMEIALTTFVERLNQDECRVFVLGCASRISPFVDPAVDLVKNLSDNKSGAFSQAVELLFDDALKLKALSPPALLLRYKAEVSAGRIGVAHGGQGNSLVEEVLAPAMRLLESVFSDDGMKVCTIDEDGRKWFDHGYFYGLDVCRIVSHLVHYRPVLHDVGGIPPWILESAEKDSLWHSLELLSQNGSNKEGCLAKVEHYSRKCKAQNIELTERAFQLYRDELSATWKNV